jgi:DNA-binding IclR family transcriptional regulator
VQILNRALQVMRVVAASRQGMTLQQLHEELNIPIGSMHRLLGALTEEQYLTRSPTNRRYFVGPAVAMFAAISDRGVPTAIAPPPALTEAARASGETTFLTELHGRHVVCVSLVEARHPLRLFVRVGQEMPLHAAASARSILAFLDDATREVLLTEAPLTNFTGDTLRTAEQVRQHLSEVRQRGYDVCDSELDDHVWAVAAPVFTSTGQVASSITIAAASARVRDPIKRTQLTETVLRAARTLSEQLGFTDNFQDSAHQTIAEPR